MIGWYTKQCETVTVLDGIEKGIDKDMAVQKIVILYSPSADDANDDEKDSEVQMAEVRDELSAWELDVIPMACTLNLAEILQTLQTLKPALVFNLVEAINGQGRLAYLSQALLDVSRIPYTGAGTNATFLTSNKLLAKDKLKAAGIPTARFFSLDALKQAPDAVAGRYIIKSVWEHASIGIGQDSIVDVTNTSALIEKMIALQPRLSGECFAEAYIDGREFNISLLAGPGGPQVMPPAEILFRDYSPNQFKILDYTAKWKSDSAAYCNTPRSFDLSASDSPLLDQLKSIALDCWQLFSLRGYARVDFRVDSAGQPFVLEINTNPCISKDAGFIAACQQGGIQYKDVLRQIINDSGESAFPSIPSPLKRDSEIQR